MPAFKASGDITSMAHADGYIEIPAQVDIVEAGEARRRDRCSDALHPSPLTRAPGFPLPDQKGACATLVDYLRAARLLLAFHRGTSCPNCRHRFGELAADYPRLHGARSPGVARRRAGSRASVRRYVEETGLPFDILIDERRDVLRAYGVWHRIGIDDLEHRATGGVPDQPGRDDPPSVVTSAQHQREFPEARDEILHPSSAGKPI